MGIVGICGGVLLVLAVLWETFETIVLPRTIVRNLRLTRVYFMITWLVYRSGASARAMGTLRESYLSTFGPLSLLGLILCWVGALILGFALIQWGLGTHVISASTRPGFAVDVYMSGTTFFTLGLGDVLPATAIAKVAIVCEAGVGLGFLAVVIGYVPVIYASFSRREVGISLLDARAGSPPTAGELLMRHAAGGNMDALVQLLATFEAWTSDLMESHLSYPVVAYYRSQHDRESWISALAAILDACALVGVGFDNDAAWSRALKWQAGMTFAMARHAIVDLSLVFHVDPKPMRTERLPAEEFQRLRTDLAAAGLIVAGGADAEARLAALRAQYEPHISGLADHLLMSLPAWRSEPEALDNWQTSAWRADSHL